MNRKSWTRVLIVIVAGLWAYNIYRTVQNYQVKTENLEERQNMPLAFAPILFNKDTFDLYLPKQDPFLKNQSGGFNQADQNAPNLIPQNPPIQPKPPVQAPVNNPQWPEITYFGFLRNHQAEHKLCILKINGKNYRLSVGDEKDNVKIVEAYPDSIRLVFNQTVKTIVKN